MHAAHSLPSQLATHSLQHTACATQLATRIQQHAASITNPHQFSMPQMGSMMDNCWGLLVCDPIEGTRFWRVAEDVPSQCSASTWPDFPEPFAKCISAHWAAIWLARGML